MSLSQHWKGNEIFISCMDEKKIDCHISCISRKIIRKKFSLFACLLWQVTPELWQVHILFLVEIRIQTYIPPTAFQVPIHFPNFFDLWLFFMEIFQGPVYFSLYLKGNEEIKKVWSIFQEISGLKSRSTESHFFFLFTGWLDLSYIVLFIFKRSWEIQLSCVTKKEKWGEGSFVSMQPMSA